MSLLKMKQKTKFIIEKKQTIYEGKHIQSLIESLKFKSFVVQGPFIYPEFQRESNKAWLKV
jgi:hypothetical protein